MDMIRHVIVRGRVQGVGFRAFVEHEALRRQLKGWVRNRRDGTVEAVFSGPDIEVEEMLDACRKGPPGSRVDGVDMKDGTADQIQSVAFIVLPTV